MGESVGRKDDVVGEEVERAAESSRGQTAFLGGANVVRNAHVEDERFVLRMLRFIGAPGTVGLGTTMGA